MGPERRTVSGPYKPAAFSHRDRLRHREQALNTWIYFARGIDWAASYATAASSLFSIW